MEKLNPYDALINTGKLFQPPSANTQLIFGTDTYCNFSVSFYRSKPFNKFQIWMYKFFFGITAVNLGG